MTGLVVRKEIRGGIGVMTTERVQATCPARGEQVAAVAVAGRVKGYCAVARWYVDFPIETQPAPTVKRPIDETEPKTSAAPAPGRDSRGRFIKGNMPANRKA